VTILSQSMKTNDRTDISAIREQVGRLSFPRLLNARDLGGYRTRHGTRTREKTLLRTDDLYKLTPEGARALLAYGVTTVIDLRWPAEAASRPSPFQGSDSRVRYAHISLLDGSEQEWSSRTPAVPKERWNCTVLEHAKREIAEVLRAVAEAPRGVVLFHCVAGKDRTGVVAALLLAAADVQPSEIAVDYAISTEYIRDAYLAASPPHSRDAVLEEVRCPPEQIYNMIAYLDSRHGGLPGYLHEIGLNENEIARIRSRLLS
jgi:protein-tyrosine phosphatase